MSEHDHDGFYWEPSPEDDLRQGDLLFNVPTALMRHRPRFVFGPGDDVKTESYDDYPENAPSDQIVVEAVFGVLGKVATPTCHIAEGEKDEEIVAVVPVQHLNLVIPSLTEARNVLAGRNVPLHLFPLPRTALGDGILRFNGVALLDRTASMLNENLCDYRRLGLYVESRIALRKAMARFWPRGNADECIERSMPAQMENRPLEDLEHLPYIGAGRGCQGPEAPTPSEASGLTVAGWRSYPTSVAHSTWWARDGSRIRGPGRGVPARDASATSRP